MKEVNSYLTGDHGDIVALMEHDWPEMTQEFKKIQQEHRKGLDYLNDISSEDYSFFGIEMELWRIGQSEPAPKFNIVVSPNEWSKSVKSATSSRTLSETKVLQKEFWTGLKDYLTENNTFLSIREPRPQHWYNFGIG